MKYICFFIISMVVLKTTAQLPAFPGAQGFGRFSVGGREGRIIEVTNLNDSGPGSFRAACETAGARTLVFKTGGVIELQTEIQLTNPYITIAGQTAPGDGIVIKNYPLSLFTHDVVIRGMRFRPGDDVSCGADNIDAIAIQQGAHHIIIDHCSLSWALDENLSIQDSAHHISIQWCIISEGLYKNIHPKGPHSMGVLVYDGANSVSIHHNLLAHNNGRNPLVMGVTNLEFVNNVIYDWGYNSEFLESGSTLKADITGNYWKPGTVTIGNYEYPLHLDFDSSTALGSKLYCINNRKPSEYFFTPAQLQGFGGNAIIFSNISLMDSITGIDELTGLNAYDSVLRNAGAVHPLRDVTDTRIVENVHDSIGGFLDCIYHRQRTIDSGYVMYATDTSFIYSAANRFPAMSPEGREVRIISGRGAGQVRHGIGVKTIDGPNRIVEGVIDTAWAMSPDSTSYFEVVVTCYSYLGSWPTYAQGSGYTDSDHDGMPDDWENLQHLNPIDSTDNNGTNLSNAGYTNLEEYLNEYYQNDLEAGLDNMAAENMQVKIFPIPFSEKAIIQINLQIAGLVKCDVYDLQGRLLKTLLNDPLTPGIYNNGWDGCNEKGQAMPNGCYLIKWQTGSSVGVCKEVLIR